MYNLIKSRKKCSTTPICASNKPIAVIHLEVWAEPISCFILSFDPIALNLIQPYWSLLVYYSNNLIHLYITILEHHKCKIDGTYQLTSFQGRCQLLSLQLKIMKVSSYLPLYLSIFFCNNLCNFVPSEEQEFRQTIPMYVSLLPLVEVITNILKYQSVEVKFILDKKIIWFCKYWQTQHITGSPRCKQLWAVWDELNTSPSCNKNLD